MVAEVVGESEPYKQSPNKPPAPPVEVFTTTLSNILEWPVAETLTKAGALSLIGVDKKSLKMGGGRGVGGWPPVAVKNLELSQESLI